MKFRAISPNWTLADSYSKQYFLLIGILVNVGFLGFVSYFFHPPRKLRCCRVHDINDIGCRRSFHDYFVTHIPTSLHSDSGRGPHHNLPHSASIPQPIGQGPLPAAPPPVVGKSTDTTVVRIPIRSAKHHFGVSVSRGQRPYNEDAYQAGIIDLPAFAKRLPRSVTLSNAMNNERAAEDPQVFYFSVFDGHGGSQCSDFLKEHLHDYIEDAANQLELKSTLRLQSTETSLQDVQSDEQLNENVAKLERELVKNYKYLIGGYFNRFHPSYFTYGRPLAVSSSTLRKSLVSPSIQEVLTYAYLACDLSFTTQQSYAYARFSSLGLTNRPINEHDSLTDPYAGHPAPSFHGGSTASVALISTPTSMPFYHPSAPSTLLTAHVGDTRVLLCSTLTGTPVALTHSHHPNLPLEEQRLRRTGASFISTDSFGESRLKGLANSRAFGDISSKRLGVSAEPDVLLTYLPPAAYSFLVLVSDGVSDDCTDQEIVDIIKEARTPEEGAREVVRFATEVSLGGDNATCLVIRLGGWERRSEGGVGSLGTREAREWRRRERSDGRMARM